MKKILLILITFFVFINVQAFEFDLNSKYVYVYNDTEDKAMYELNSNDEIKVASMTKIMTAIIVIENNKDLERKIVIKDEDLRDIYVYTNVGFQAGHEVTIKELLYGILLKSGSDAVNAAVRVTCNTEEEFINLMNQKVKELNLKNTHFSNAIGKDKDNYSSVHDIAKIMEYCLKNETFKEIISTEMYYIDRLNLQINGPLYKMDDKYGINLDLIKGAKSGYTSAAMHSLVSYGEKDNTKYITVVDYASNYKQMLTDTNNLYKYFFDNYGYHEYKSSFEIDISNSKEEKKYNVDINTLLYLKNDYDKGLLNYKYDGVDKITLLNKKGSKLGKVGIYYDNELIKEIDIKLNKNIKYQTGKIIFPNVSVIIIISLSVIFCLVFIKKKTKNKKIRQENLVKFVKVKPTNKKINKQRENNIVLKEQKEAEQFLQETNSREKKLEILENSIDINLFFDTLKNSNNIDKIKIEKNFVDRCFQDIDFKNIEELKELYTKFKLYKNEMCKETIKYYNTLFKYCIEKYIEKC